MKSSGTAVNEMKLNSSTGVHTKTVSKMAMNAYTVPTSPDVHASKGDLPHAKRGRDSDRTVIS